MEANIPKLTLTPPAGRPNWKGGKDLPLIYLGWGRRDFSKSPVDFHYDLGTNYYLVVRGEITILTGGITRVLRGPAICLFDAECAFGIGQAQSGTVEILVWIWRGRPLEESVAPAPGGFRELPLNSKALPALLALHERCRDEVALADAATPSALAALQRLVDIEICRAGGTHRKDQSDVRWELSVSWIAANLSLRAPVPALCDYLRMSANTLHRFFQRKAGVSPGVYFRERKLQEARRLINECGWQVKSAAFHLGYRHANDLSRALAKPRRQLKKTDS